MSTNDSKLFSSIKYYAADFPDSSLEATFKQNGAIRSFYLTETTTHVICDDFDSNKNELEQAIEIYQTPIVKSQWIRACLKCNSLLPIEPYLNTEHLFRSCIFTNANLSHEDHEKLYALVTYYGGQWVANLDDSICTHIICASALPSRNTTDDETTNEHSNIDERLQRAYEMQSNEKIHLITPDWIVDCIRNNRIFDEIEYHPDLLRDPNDPMDVDDDELDDEQNISLNNQSTDEQTPTKTSSISHRSQLISKNFFNQSDPTTPPPPSSTDPISAGNDSSNPPDSADVTQTKPFPPKRARARATTSTPRQRNTKVNSTVNANLHANQNGHASSMKDGPMSTLPIEEKLIRPSISQNNKINSQFSRQTSLENLSYELNYSLQDKLELVPSSQCLVGCIIYIHEQEYISTVSKDDLSSWSKTLVDHGAILTNDIHQNDLTHFVCAYRTSELFREVYKRGTVRMVTAYWLNDVLQRKKLFVPNLAIHYPSPFDINQPDKLPLVNYYFTLTGFDGIERARLRYMIRSLGGKYSGHLSKIHTHLLAREQGKSEKFKKALQWSIPIVNGLWLSELYLGNTCALKQPLEERYKRLSGTPPIDHFSFDQIFVHDLLTPWSQSIRITDDILNAAIRRHNEYHPHTAHDMEFNQNYLKNSFHYTQPMIECPTMDSDIVSIMLSGFNRSTLNHYETIIKSLGGQISTVPHQTTHLIMNRFLRTEKLYECLNYVTYVLNKTWLDKCSEANRYLPIEKSDWIDNEELSSNENFFQQSISKRLERNNRLLFHRYRFFLTPSVQPSYLILKSIIYSSGGQIQRELPRLKQIRDSIDVKSNINDCLILSCEKDQIFFQDFHSTNIRIFSTDFLLQSILQQEILNIDSFVLRI